MFSFPLTERRGKEESVEYCLPVFFIYLSQLFVEGGFDRSYRYTPAVANQHPDKLKRSSMQHRTSRGCTVPRINDDGTKIGLERFSYSP
jgi:hypothetical protein